MYSKEQLGLSSSVTDFKISGGTAMAQAGTSEKNCVVLYWLVLYTCDPILVVFLVLCWLLLTHVVP